MDDADKKLEIGLESIYDRIRRPIKRCYLKLAVTQNVLQGLAICHFASPWEQTQKGFNNWLYWMQQFSLLPNCYFKLSGFSMFTHSFPIENFLNYANSAINIFGPDRCMLGSNFPVDKLHMTYKELLNAWQVLLNDYNLSDQNWLSEKTAERFYSLNPT